MNNHLVLLALALLAHMTCDGRDPGFSPPAITSSSDRNRVITWPITSHACHIGTYFILRTTHINIAYFFSFFLSVYFALVWWISRPLQCQLPGTLTLHPLIYKVSAETPPFSPMWRTWLLKVLFSAPIGGVVSKTSTIFLPRYARIWYYTGRAH